MVQTGEVFEGGAVVNVDIPADGLRFSSPSKFTRSSFSIKVMLPVMVHRQLAPERWVALASMIKSPPRRTPAQHHTNHHPPANPHLRCGHRTSQSNGVPISLSPCWGTFIGPIMGRNDAGPLLLAKVSLPAPYRCWWSWSRPYRAPHPLPFRHRSPTRLPHRRPPHQWCKPNRRRFNGTVGDTEMSVPRGGVLHVLGVMTR